MIYQDKSHKLFSFKDSDNLRDWFIVDDGVMGGLSKGDISLGNDGEGIFSGYVTTANNGGFSSVHYRMGRTPVSQFKNVLLTIKGDGKKYQFRIKSSVTQRESYITHFDTSGEWETISIPLNSFYPSFRGYKLDQPNFDGQVMEEIAFLIANKVDERFILSIREIVLR
jgi:hypothetical protein